MVRCIIAKFYFKRLMVRALHPIFAIQIGSHTKDDLMVRIKSSGTEVASSGTELNPVEPIVQHFSVSIRVAR
uniref:Uncharacterized protein n=1 Tax=Romanomermis culicivorax TaxID=13658 RepID=A0A915JDE6_ROMCU